jgi:hypothetical protein
MSELRFKIRRVPKDIEVEYTVKNGKLKGKKITEGIYYNFYYSHRILFCGCNRNNKEIQKYINELRYKIVRTGQDIYQGNYVIIFKSLNDISKEELETIEANMVANKLGGNIIN